jgi:ribosomal protein S18 acetylase RimI-like enzyme
MNAHIEESAYELVERAPSVSDYRALRAATGLSAKSDEAAAVALPNTWHGVTLRHNGVPVGMGRIIGDGGCFFQIVDICVLPQHQGRGLGKRIMQALTTELERRAPASAYVSLIADGEARHLYEKFGFQVTSGASVGMERRF